MEAEQKSETVRLIPTAYLRWNADGDLEQMWSDSTGRCRWAKVPHVKENADILRGPGRSEISGGGVHGKDSGGLHYIGSGEVFFQIR